VHNWSLLDGHPVLTHVKVVHRCNESDKHTDVQRESVPKKTVKATMAMEMIQKEIRTHTIIRLEEAVEINNCCHICHLSLPECGE